MKHFSPRWPTAALLALSIIGSAAIAAVSYVERQQFTVTRAGATVETFVGTKEACQKRLRELAEADGRTNGTVTFACQTERQVLVATFTADPPPSCSAPKPDDETRPQSCPAGTTGTWSQTRTYSAAPYPTCWTAGTWSPASAPAGACVPIPPAPVDCVVSDWSTWSGGEWSACVNGSRSRTETRTRTIVTPASNGGAACPTLTESKIVVEACTVIPPDPNPPEGAIVVSPGESISAAVAKLQPGGTVIVKPGTYSAFSLKACAAAAWCTVKAETDGTVTVNGLSIGRGNWYVRLEGFKFTGSGSKSITGSYVKVFRTAFEGGPASGNSMAVQIGTNDYSPGASFVLLEDVWAYAPGGRYKFLVYNATDVVLRRVVSRYDGSQQGEGAPQADITVYDSQRVEVQNAIALDTVVGSGSSQYLACFYNVRNNTGGVGDGFKFWRGDICINTGGYIMGTEGQGAQTNVVVENVAGYVGEYGISQLNASNAKYSFLTVLKFKNDGVGIYGGSASLASSVVAGNGQNLRGISCSSCDTTQTVKWLTTPAPSGRGASILKRYGVSGTLYGEPGYNTLTDQDLWPYPNEARIKADFDTVRPAFGGKSLTDYVWGQLGTARP